MSSSVVLFGESPDVFARLESEVGLVTVVRVCTDGAELLATLAAGLARYVIVVDQFDDVDSGLVDAVHAAGGRLVAVTDDAKAASRLFRLGVGSVGSSASAEVIAEALSRAEPLKRRGRRRAETVDEFESVIPDDLSQLHGVEPRTGLPHLPDIEDPANNENQSSQPEGSEPETVQREPGRIVVVWSGAGAPGRSFLSIELATEAALAGKSVTLVDADTRASSIAARLGMLGETSGIVRLCRSVEAGTFSPNSDTDAHARVRIGKAILRVTTGLPRPSRWQEVGKAALKRSLEALREASELVIVDVAAPADNDQDIAFDTFAPQRDDATLTALEMADDVVVIGTADAVGLPRLMRAVGQAPELTQGRISVVVNQVPKGAARGVKLAWERFGPKGFRPEVFIPKDDAAVEHALDAATALSHAAARSAARGAIRDFACSLCECGENLETPLKAARGGLFKARVKGAPSVTGGT